MGKIRSLNAPLPAYSRSAGSSAFLTISSYRARALSAGSSSASIIFPLMSIENLSMCAPSGRGKM